MGVGATVAVGRVPVGVIGTGAVPGAWLWGGLVVMGGVGNTTTGYGVGSIVADRVGAGVQRGAGNEKPGATFVVQPYSVVVPL